VLQLGPYKVKVMLAEPKTKRNKLDALGAMGIFNPQVGHSATCSVILLLHEGGSAVHVLRHVLHAKACWPMTNIRSPTDAAGVPFHVSKALR
jgi:hypothetical protein